MLVKFRPILAPNDEVALEQLTYPLLASFKLDGIRCIFKDGQMYSRALKKFPNIQLEERFRHLMLVSKELNIILDGELLSKSTSFNDLSGISHALDRDLPSDLHFYCFDCVPQEKFDMGFEDRSDILNVTFKSTADAHFKLVKQVKVNNAEEAKTYYETALAWGCDGLILRSSAGRYKHGRATLKEGLIYKLKPFRTFDAQVIGIEQATEVRAGAEKKTNELGLSVTSKKKADRVLINKASAFIVIHNGKELKVTLAMTDEEKQEVWNNKNNYIGKYIEYKGLLVGAKDLPRHPVYLRLRVDKEN